MKRTFIAIRNPLSEKLKQEYELIRYRLRLEKINWVPENNLHLTLNFLGDTKEEVLPELIDNLRNITSAYKPFIICLRTFGVFKSLHEPRVLWIGCDADPVLGQMYNDFKQCLNHMGFETENRNYSPHLTLGRVKEIRQLNQLTQLITLFKDTEFQRQTVNQIVLFESKLLPEGVDYVPLQKFLLPVSD